MPRPLNEQVVVITGASPGIGRSAAVRFGHAGASVVLAARGVEALHEVAREIERVGGRALAISTDVSAAGDVNNLADQGTSAFGRIDTWINNAAVSEYALLPEMTPEEIERILAVNLLGQILGSRAALLQMKRQGAGTIINVASALAERSVPLQSVYSASKHGVQGFTEALRLEVKREPSDIHVCLVLPSSTNTPLFTNARSKVGQKPMPIPPIYEPEAVAECLLDLAVKPKRDVVVGGSGKLLTIADKLSPSLVDWYMLQGDRMFKSQLSGRPDDQVDNLFAPLPGTGAEHGEFGSQAKAGSLYTRLFELHPARKMLVLVGLLLTGMVARRRHPARN